MLLALTGLLVSAGAVLFSHALNEASGTVAADSSGSNRLGTVVAGTWVAGKAGNGLKLVTNGYLRNDNPGTMGSTFTASMWVNPAGTAAWQNLMERLTSAGVGWEVDLEPGGQISLWVNGALKFTTAAALPANTWSYVSIVRDGSEWQLYVNGTLRNSATDPTAFSYGTCPFLFGVDADTECTGALNGYLDGTIDEIMVYDVALTAAQIQADMNNQPVVPITAAPGQPVIAWAKFGQMSFAWDYADPRPSEFRLYVSAGQSSGCPGPIYTSVPGTSLTATVSHVPWGVTHSAQVSAFSTGESVCSDLVSGLPK